MGIAASLSLVSGSALAAPRLITNPDWLEQPSGEALAEHYPALANALEIDGFAQIACEVTDKGLLERCKIDAEGPKGLGFGRAAVAMSSAFRMRPKTVDGEPVSGGIARIPIRFKLPEISPAPPAPPATPDVRASALYIADVQASSVEAALEDQLATLLGDASTGTDEATRQAAVRALRAASRRHAAGLRGGVADALIATLTPEEIVALRAFNAATSGSAMRERPSMAQLASEISSRMSTYVTQELRNAFCEQASCAGAPAELAAVAAAGSDATMEVERWNRSPSIREIMSATPIAASLLGVTGSARLACDAEADGALRNCSIAAEAPAGWGYGEAALGLASRYRLEPIQEGAASTNRRVTLRVRFPALPIPEVEAVPVAESTAAVKMARKLVDTYHPQATVAAQLPSLISTLVGAVGPLRAEQVEAAVKTGVPRAIDRTIDDVANLIAADFSEAEIAAMVDFEASPAGRSVGAKGPQLEAAIVAAVRRSQSLIAADARAEFCADRDCGAPQALPAVWP